MSVLTAIGLMSGEAIDGVRAAMIRTDGESVVELGPSHFAPYDRDMKIMIRRAIKAAVEGRDGAADIGKAAGEITQTHAIAVAEILEQAGLKRTEIDVIGLHGHTILHRPKRAPESVGRTWQIGDGKTLAEETRIDVVSGFRNRDIAEGGEGSPLTPVYLLARVGALKREGAVGVFNLDAVANITFIPHAAKTSDLVAFDCGPGLGLLDQWVELKAGAAIDAAGALARSGQIHTDILRLMLLSPYVRRKPPKFLDSRDFKLGPLLGLSAVDGAATLTALIGACARAALAHLPCEPGEWIVTGEGRRNEAAIEALSKALGGSIDSAESVGWDGDALDAECVAYLAVRSLRKLPLTFPRTTRAPRPIRGGVHHRAPV